MWLLLLCTWAFVSMAASIVFGLIGEIVLHRRGIKN
jgi:hypothetical protein